MHISNDWTELGRSFNLEDGQTKLDLEGTSTCARTGISQDADAVNGF